MSENLKFYLSDQVENIRLLNDEAIYQDDLIFKYIKSVINDNNQEVKKTFYQSYLSNVWLFKDLILLGNAAYLTSNLIGSIQSAKTNENLQEIKSFIDQCHEGSKFLIYQNFDPKTDHLLETEELLNQLDRLNNFLKSMGF